MKELFFFFTWDVVEIWETKEKGIVRVTEVFRPVTIVVSCSLKDSR